MRERYRDVSRNYDELQASCRSLLQSYHELKGQLAQLNESLRTELDRLTEENRQLEERLRVEGMLGWIMATKTAHTLHEIVQVTAIDLLSYPKLDLALQEAEMASLKHLAHPLEMIELTNCEAKAIVEFLSGKQANVTEGVRYGLAVSYNETLYSVSMIFTWIPPVIS